MKPLFFFLFSVFAAVISAGEHVSAPIWYSEVPMSEAVTIYELPMPITVSDTFTTVSEPEIVEYRVLPEPSRPYIVAKPAELPLTVPPPLAPLLPIQNQEKKETITVRGQSATVNELNEILQTPPPHAQGAVEEGTIDPKMTEGPVLSESNDAFVTADPDFNKNTQTGSSAQTAAAAETKPDQFVYGTLLVSTVITTIGLIYMAFVAYDYRQRWMQSLMAQNDRYIGSGLDSEAEEMYGGSMPLSENFGLMVR